MRIGKGRKFGIEKFFMIAFSTSALGGMFRGHKESENFRNIR